MERPRKTILVTAEDKSGKRPPKTFAIPGPAQSRQECRERERMAKKFVKKMKGNHDPELIFRLFMTGMDDIRETYDKEKGAYLLQVCNPRHVNIKLDEEAFTNLNGLGAPGRETTLDKTDSPSLTENSSSSSAPGDTGDITIISRDRYVCEQCGHVEQDCHCEDGYDDDDTGDITIIPY